MSTSITLQGLTKRFASGRGTKPGASGLAVDDVSLRIEPGELFFLLGPSGCGKTTLLRMIAGFIEPTAGSITFGDPPTSRDVTRVPPNKRNTGMVFQSYALWPHMSVQANVAFGLSVQNVDRRERDRRVAAALEMVRMGEYIHRKPNQLSGGQQQRVALARALVVRPDVLLLDEPLSNLDAALRIELRSEIRRICKEPMSDRDHDLTHGMTTVYVTHDQKEAMGMADRIAVMQSGRIVQLGTPSELYRQPINRFVAEFMGETNLISGVVQTFANGLVIVRTPVGDIAAAAPSRVQATAGVPIVCSIRPESVRFSAAGDYPNRFNGTLLESTYLGDVQQSKIGLEAGLEIKVVDQNPRREQGHLGSQVSVTVDSDDVTLLPA
jgi:iron(III) transport system ATP-binding protein